MISVIVPVYNVEKYLDECVQSILSQTYRDYELILVDDGSTDSSGKMCDDYEKKDGRIRVIHKENGGLSDARNVGTGIARGSHITYVDSDDYVSRKYLEKLYKLLTQFDAEIAVIGIQQFYDGSIPQNIKTKSVNIYTNEEALSKVFYQDGMDTSACALLIPLDIAQRTSFPCGKYHEDDFTTYKYYLQVKHVAVCEETHYFYRQRRGSIMHSFGSASQDELEAADNLVLFCNANMPNLVKAANSKKFSDYCQVLLSDDSIRQKQPEEFRRIMKYLDEQKMSIIKDKKTRFKNKVAAMCLMINYDFLKFINRLKRKAS